MIRLVATLVTAVVVVWVGSRVVDECDTEVWQAHKTALRERLAQAARSVAIVDEEPQAGETAGLTPEASPMPQGGAVSQAPEMGSPVEDTRSGGVGPVVGTEDAGDRRGSFDDFDVEQVRRRLDRVMSLAAGLAR